MPERMPADVLAQIRQEVTEGLAPTVFEGRLMLEEIDGLQASLDGLSETAGNAVLRMNNATADVERLRKALRRVDRFFREGGYRPETEPRATVLRALGRGAE